MLKAFTCMNKSESLVLIKYLNRPKKYVKVSRSHVTKTEYCMRLKKMCARWEISMLPDTVILSYHQPMRYYLRGKTKTYNQEMYI